MSDAPDDELLPFPSLETSELLEVRRDPLALVLDTRRDPLELVLDLVRTAALVAIAIALVVIA